MTRKDLAIERYQLAHEQALFSLLSKEGWTCYCSDEDRFTRYKEALGQSISYVLIQDESLCGYIRCHNDYGNGVYVYDLLVDQKYRGQGYGNLLMSKVKAEFPKTEIYVLSGVDKYYEKLKLKKAGSIFEIN
ncbi:GNAT family N-acetyltransferase [Candidatus Enterococcus ferrettii]|uniref:N-acetyltransferase domain-containing protein n=1 Tax=Candidatus Enterococcus ferrettii TaxID=2815324 RepID=A0ABV0EX67_9ENTE|nr:GNAT family N-acetyltransferase [Enterococcus sp. 665A]MBO1343065.1 GNAT family N-acetyltransferase [Enterococcus sp. 665A]